MFSEDDDIGIEGAIVLSELLKTNTTLTTVAFDSLKQSIDVRSYYSHELKQIDNGFGDEGANEISEALKVNTTLSNFNLRSLKRKSHQRSEWFDVSLL